MFDIKFFSQKPSELKAMLHSATQKKPIKQKNPKNCYLDFKLNVIPQIKNYTEKKKSLY
jgi:hypothetical protein